MDTDGEMMELAVGETDASGPPAFSSPAATGPADWRGQSRHPTLPCNVTRRATPQADRPSTITDDEHASSGAIAEADYFASAIGSAAAGEGEMDEEFGGSSLAATEPWTPTATTTPDRAQMAGLDDVAVSGASRGTGANRDESDITPTADVAEADERRPPPTVAATKPTAAVTRSVPPETRKVPRQEDPGRARRRLEEMQKEHRKALAAVQRSTLAGIDEAGSVFAMPVAKSAMEQADDKAAAVLGQVVGETIQEDLEEDEMPAAAGEAAKPVTDASDGQRDPQEAHRQEQELVSALMAQFDAATAAADAAGEAELEEEVNVPDARSHIEYEEAAAALLDGAELAPQLEGIVREDWSSSSFWLRLLPALRPRLRSAELRQQRDRLLALARVPMDGSALHERVVGACYRALTHTVAAPPRYGGHWEAIGFQGASLARSPSHPLSTLVSHPRLSLSSHPLVFSPFTLDPCPPDNLLP